MPHAQNGAGSTVRVLVNLDVPDLAQAIAFYREALGLSLKRMIGEDVAELAGASTPIYLLRRPAGSHPARGHTVVRGYARHWTPVHIDFVVDELDQAAQRALASGATRESACSEWHGAKCVTFADPFGHGFCLVEFAGEDYAGTGV